MTQQDATAREDSEEKSHHRCQTLLVDDKPAKEDAFSTSVDNGPHKRVADAIVELVSTEEGGRAIGLEGAWGAGKSTIVRFVRDELEGRTHFRTISFDAWAHEGDPLRRTYLETIVRQLRTADASKAWLGAVWSDKLEEISKKKRITDTTISPEPTPLGGWLAFTVFLVPLGTALVSANWGEITFKPTGSIAWGFILGFILAVGPLLVLIAHWLFLKTPRGKNLQESYPRDGSRCAWQLLVNHSVADSKTETTESTDPTSIEFGDYFDQLTHEALGPDPLRRLLLILDNLDRVEPHSALAIWSTLQTFLQERDEATKPWFTQIWVLVPYDPEGLGKLWENRDHAGPGQRKTSPPQPTDRSNSETFLEKSFQVRFQTPPPVLSDWKAFLHAQLTEAMPDISEKHDWHGVYRVYEACRPHHREPTLREIKVFVNQVGMIHRQWQHEFPLRDVAYFVLYGAGKGLLERLRSNAPIPKEHAGLLSDTAVQSLAGLVFNSPASKGMELLLRQPIEQALDAGDGDALRTLADGHPQGFLPLLEKVMTGVDRDVGGVHKCAQALKQADVLEPRSRPEVKVILRSLRSRLIKSASRSEGADLTAGSCFALELIREEQVTRSFLEGVANRHASPSAAAKPPPAAPIPELLVPLIHCAQALGHAESIPKSFAIAGDASAVVDWCHALSKVDPTEASWQYFRPTASGEEIKQQVVAAIHNGTFGEREAATIKVTTAMPVEIAWQQISLPMGQRLSPNQGTSPDETGFLLSAMWDLRRSHVGAPEPRQALRQLAKSGIILHYLHRAREDVRQVLLCGLTYLEFFPTNVPPTAVGDSINGFQTLQKVLRKEPIAPGRPPLRPAVGDPEEVRKLLLELSEVFGPFTFLFDVLDQNQEHQVLVREYFRSLAMSPRASSVFSPQVLTQKWPMIRQSLQPEASKLLTCLVEKAGLVDDLQKETFSAHAALLYSDLIRERSAEDFVSWCAAGLRSLDRNAWIEAFSGEFSCIELANAVAKRQTLLLPTAFGEAIKEHATALMQGQRLPPDHLLQAWSDLPNYIGNDGTPQLVAEHVLRTASQHETIHEAFFRAFGRLLANQDLLTEHANEAFRLFATLLNSENVAGLEWLKTTLEQFRKLAQHHESPHAKHFVARVAERLAEPLDESVRPLLDRLATLMDLDPKGHEHQLEEEPKEEKV